MTLADGEENLTFTENLYIPLLILCFQPMSLYTPRCPTIILLSAWMLMSILLVGFYTGQITSVTLSPPFSEKPINSIADLMNTGKYWLVSEGTIYAKAYEAYPQLKKTLVYIDHHDNVTNLEQILKEPHTYTKPDNWNLPIYEAIRHILEPDGRNPFYFGKDTIMIYFNSWIVGKNCPFTKDMALAILRVQESGLYTYYKRKLFTREKEKIKKYGKLYVDRPSINITLSHFFRMAEVFSFRYLMGIVIFILELLAFKFYHR